MWYPLDTKGAAKISDRRKHRGHVGPEEINAGHTGIQGWLKNPTQARYGARPSLGVCRATPDCNRPSSFFGQLANRAIHDSP
jgi:hypothetical protein